LVSIHGISFRLIGCAKISRNLPQSVKRPFLTAEHPSRLAERARPTVSIRRANRSVFRETPSVRFPNRSNVRAKPRLDRASRRRFRFPLSAFRFAMSGHFSTPSVVRAIRSMSFSQPIC
jgi:hypothetical protein